MISNGRQTLVPLVKVMLLNIPSAICYGFQKAPQDTGLESSIADVTLQAP